MLELNLNLLMTFFWLSLSAGLLLPGIWFLIDGKINLSIINFILQRFDHYGKLTNNGLISKSYFLYFYLFGLLINLIFFVFHLSFFLLFLIFLLHLSRRLYECIYIQKFTSKMNFLQILFGFIHYPCVGLTIIIDYQYPYTNIQFWKYLFALILFFNASYIQYNVHLTLAKLIRCENDIYPIPNGYWIFNYLSCPNIIAEIFIYLSFLIASHRTSAMTALIVWVFVNQSLSALLNHRWYCRYYKELYPSKRCALIPFIL
jgi:hypothetical protein